MSNMSISAYADALLLDFADAVHAELTRILRDHFGDAWLVDGVRRHFRPEQFSRVEAMLQNPMRAVHMNKTAAELHGLEHFWNIINGNWVLFRSRFRDKSRTEVFFGEIAELRHNLAHRRKHHTLPRGNLIRIVDNCRMVLSALDSSEANRFAEVVESLSTGAIPWGPPLDGHLPASDEICAEFVGRPDELETLSDWLASDSPQILVWGYGGAGKSALAHKFARDVRDGSSEDLVAVCWVSAKRSEYVEGAVRDRVVDFHDTPTLIRSVWSALYSAEDHPDDLSGTVLVRHLQEMPILLVVDDFDTVSDDEELTQFLLHDLRTTLTRVIYTSRHRVPGIKNLEVPPFSQAELRRFVSLRSLEYGANEDQCLKRVDGIRRVTSGYPLFVDDLIHHAVLVGVDEALRLWSQKRGDAAREYALRRQVEYLGPGCGNVLIALSVGNRALILQEISNVAGLTDEDSEAGLRELLRWRMVNPVKDDQHVSPAYRMNNNTRRLVQQTFKGDHRVNSYAAAFAALTGERVPEAKRRAVGRVISQTTTLERSEGLEAAIEHLQERMVGELIDAPDLHGVLGRLYAQRPNDATFCTEARSAFERAHSLGATKTDLYYHWLWMEKSIAETMISGSQGQPTSTDEIVTQWKECGRIVETGIERCGVSQLLCYWAGYVACREAKSWEYGEVFAEAQGAYTRSRDWHKKALMAPVSDAALITKDAIYRGLTLALEGLGDVEELRAVLLEWGEFVRGGRNFASEYRRLAQRYPRVRSDAALGAVLRRHASE